jgi:hypothetical protein
MRKLLALLPAAALLAQGCGDTCSTAATEVQPSNGCNVGVAAGTTIIVTAKPTCQSCSQTSPSCNISDAGAGAVFLDVTVKECEADKGCTSPSCSFNNNVSCSYAISPAASGPLTINYRTGGSTGSETLTVGGGSATSCTL